MGYFRVWWPVLLGYSSHSQALYRSPLFSMISVFGGWGSGFGDGQGTTWSSGGF